MLRCDVSIKNCYFQKVDEDPIPILNTAPISPIHRSQFYVCVTEINHHDFKLTPLFLSPKHLKPHILIITLPMSLIELNYHKSPK